MLEQSIRNRIVRDAVFRMLKEHEKDGRADERERLAIIRARCEAEPEMSVWWGKTRWFLGYDFVEKMYEHSLDQEALRKKAKADAVKRMESTVLNFAPLGLLPKMKVVSEPTMSDGSLFGEFKVSSWKFSIFIGDDLLESVSGIASLHAFFNGMRAAFAVIIADPDVLKQLQQ